jgi:uncharacterized membrane protein
MLILSLAFLMGLIAGLRAFTAPAVISWSVRFGILPLTGTWLHLLGSTWTRWIFTLGALIELINDKLPSTLSRKTPPQFIIRILMGSLCGAALTTPQGHSIQGMIAGALGAVVGTLGGAGLRKRLTEAIGGKDLPIALLEDCIAILGGILLVSRLF